MKNQFDVSEIKVYPFKNSDTKTRAFAQVVLNGALRLTNLRVVEGENGLFVGYPSEKSKDGKYFDIVHPITRECRNVIQQAILPIYEKTLAECC